MPEIEKKVEKKPGAGGPPAAAHVELPKPTPDQQNFLENIGKSSKDYNPEVIVGGPRRTP